MQLVRGTYDRQPVASRPEVAAGDPHPAALLIATVDGGALRFDLTRSLVRVGRALGCDLVIIERMVRWDTASRHHARLYYSHRLGRWAIKDEGSRNGVYVNGVRTGHNLLRDGARLAFGGVEALFREQEQRDGLPV
jgi:pSer/pThr/pTyr-binding forkhead associated (FHA) protein